MSDVLDDPWRRGDYGEPWEHDEGGVYNRHGRYPLGGTEHVARAVACVNACAGIVDPAAELAALRAVAEAARECVARDGGFIEMKSAGCRPLLDALAALDKLRAGREVEG